MEFNKDERKAIEKKIHRSACFQRTFSDDNGKVAFDEIDAFTSYKNDTFDLDPYMSAYNAGRRSVSIFIHNAFEGDIEKAKQMLKESKNATEL